MRAAPSLGDGQIVAVAEEVFAAMVDCEPGRLTPHDGPATLVEPVYAWVEVRSTASRRIVLAAGVATAQDLARALLRLGGEELISEEDLVDAFGEVANVVGGNIKSLHPTDGVLTLPSVRRQAPSAGEGTKLDEVTLTWRGQPLAITVWQI